MVDEKPYKGFYIRAPANAKGLPPEEGSNECILSFEFIVRPTSFI